MLLYCDLLVTGILLLCYGECSTLHPTVPLNSASGEVNLPSNCSSGENNCPAGLFCSELGQCECKPLLNDLVVCEKKRNEVHLMVPYGYCVTSDGQEGGAVTVGACSAPMTNSCLISTTGSHSMYYNILPGELNNPCTRAGRTGALCGRCLPDHYPLAYSFSLTCIPCPHPRWNWLRYIMAAYLPLTLFYFFILFFNVRTMSGRVHAAICVCQAISSPLAIRYFNSVCSTATLDFASVSLKTVFSLYGIWNLDFFRLFYSDLCLGIGILPTLALDYAVALYPLLLMAVSYLLITLHDRNYRVVTVVWSPFRRLFSLFRRNWDIKTSVIDSFATFFFLSNVTLLSVSFDLLFPTTIQRFDGTNSTSSLRLLYAPEIEYFGKEHLPFGVLAIAVLLLGFLLPVFLLTLYPFRFFHRLLNLLPFRWYILHTFMDSFLGCYKDGTQPGTRDCRVFLGLFMGSRFLMFMTFCVTNPIAAYAVIALLVSILVAVVMVIRPFKTPPRHSNLIFALYLQMSTLTALSLVAANLSFFFDSRLSEVLIALFIISSFIPLIDFLRVISTYIFKRRRGILRPLVNCWRRRRYQLRGYESLPGEGGVAGKEEEEVLADRIVNPNNYLAGNLSILASLQAKNETENGKVTY